MKSKGKKPVVAILNGLMNPIPPVKGGGPQIVIYNTCMELDDAPFDWFVLSNWDPQLEDTDYDRDKFIAVKTGFIERLLVTIISLFPHRVIKGIFGVVRKDHLTLNLKLVRNLISRKCDVIVVHDSYPLTYLCHQVFPRKKIVFYHHNSKMHLDLTEKRWNRLVRSASAGMVAICEKAFEYTDAQFNLHPTNKWVIYNGVNSSLFYEPNLERKYQLRQEHAINPDEIVFIYVGRISEIKGVDLLIECASEVVQESFRPVTLLVIGSTQSDEGGSLQFETKLRARADELSKEKIVFLGFVPNEKLGEYYNLSDFGILPTRLLEGNSLFLMECLAAGTPVIATRKGGVPEVFRDGKDGILIDEEDLEKDLKPVMLEVIKNNEYWQSKKTEIAEAARQRFAYQRVAQEFSQVVESVLKDLD